MLMYHVFTDRVALKVVKLLCLIVVFLWAI